ncbi:MAG: helix-turn-helix transcriptional regulator [Lachnospiraceae bacterium]|nr:helix-turn-helix transcriptional regulator [Lachnospiraceae bacterium]
MPTIDMAATGRNIRDRRLKAGMTVVDVTKACGVSAAAVCKWQSGQCLPTIDNMIILAAI